MGYKWRQFTGTPRQFIKHATKLGLPWKTCPHIIHAKLAISSLNETSHCHWWDIFHCYCYSNLSMSDLLSAAIRVLPWKCWSLRSVLVLDLMFFTQLKNSSRLQVTPNTDINKTCFLSDVGYVFLIIQRNLTARWPRKTHRHAAYREKLSFKLTLTQKTFHYPTPYNLSDVCTVLVNITSVLSWFTNRSLLRVGRTPISQDMTILDKTCREDYYIRVMMQAVQTSETSVNSYQSTRRYNPEGSHLHSYRRENLKLYTMSYSRLRRNTRFIQVTKTCLNASFCLLSLLSSAQSVWQRGDTEYSHASFFLCRVGTVYRKSEFVRTF
jgi:hypothetical protein